MGHVLDMGYDLVAARRERRMSQRELGERVGVAQQQIARWEASGYSSAALERVDAVSRALGYDPAASDLRMTPMVAETHADYRANSGSVVPVVPVRDLGQVASRVREHAPELNQRFGIERVGVFGSFAEGTQGEESDVDLLVDMPDPGGLKFLQAAQFMEDILGRTVDFLRPQGVADSIRHEVLESVIHVWAAQ